MEGRGEGCGQQFFFNIEERCPFSKGNRYKDYVTDIFPRPNFVSPEWRYPLNRGAQQEIFHALYKYLLFCSNSGHL